MPPETVNPENLPDIKDIAGPETLPNLWEVVALIGGIILGVAVLGVVIFFLYRILTRQSAPKPTPLMIARRKLDQLARQIDALEPNPFSLAVSDTLKDYLSARFGDPVRYETSEEFLQRLAQAQANALPVTLREKVAGFLSVADKIKYGRPHDAEARKRPLLDQAREVLVAEPVPENAESAQAKRSSAPPKRQKIVS